MQKDGLIFCGKRKRTTKVLLFLFLCSFSMTAFGAELLADEQGPTSEQAVATLTAGDDFLLPSYVVPAETPQKYSATAPVPSDVDILNEIFGTSDVASLQPAPQKTVAQHTFSPRTGVQQMGENALLTPLPPLPVIPMEQVIEPKKPVFEKQNYVDQALAMAGVSGSSLNMPREIRITFYPGQSTFSAQALKWAKSFALRVVNDPRLVAEIRVSDKNWPLQQKRLRVLLQLLKETGVSKHQLRLYKSDRPEDSILMGYANNPTHTMAGKDKQIKGGIQKTIEW